MSSTAVRDGTRVAVKHVLFPFDFSEACRATVPFVDAMARIFSSRITLMSVSTPSWGSKLDERRGFTRAGHLEVDLKSRLDAEMGEAFGPLPVERVAESGDPGARITRFAQERGVDLIMMPARGYGSLRSVLVGSVTSVVLRDSKTPVWTAAHRKGLPYAQHLPCRDILCAVDGTAKSTALMQWAAEFSRQTGASLSLLHVVPPISDWEALESERTLQEQVREGARAKLEDLRDLAGVDAPMAIAVGEIAATVTEEARRHGADLLLIGRGSIHEPLGRLRTHALEMVQKAPCPVLSI